MSGCSIHTRRAMSTPGSTCAVLTRAEPLRGFWPALAQPPLPHPFTMIPMSALYRRKLVADPLPARRGGSDAGTVA